MMTSCPSQSAHVHTGCYFGRFEVRGEDDGNQLAAKSSYFMLLFLSRQVSLSLSVVPKLIPTNLVLHSKPISLSPRASRLIAQCCTLSADATSRTRVSMPERRPFVRLPTDVYPVNYALCLKPDLIDFTFEGKLEAVVEVGLLLMQ